MLKYTFNLSLLLFSLMSITSCGSDEDPGTPAGGGPDENFEVWSGDKITFTKADNTDATIEANQDRINDDVFITRGTSGGEIFNIKTETSSSKGTGPEGTEWALGTTSNISNLNFSSFRDAVNPQDAPGKNLVLHLISADVYLDVKFSSWSQGKVGGFAYERSTE